MPIVRRIQIEGLEGVRCLRVHLSGVRFGVEVRIARHDV
jgi:hypothetical protein